MTFNWILLVCAGICYLCYNIVIALRIKHILSIFNYKIRYKFVFLSHMAGKLHDYLSLGNYSTTVITALSKKDIPVLMGAAAVHTDYRSNYITLLSIIAWIFRFTGWICIIIFSILTEGKLNHMHLLVSIILILFIESIINLAGLKTLRSLDKPPVKEELFEHYNAIDGDSDEKAYNSDMCVQRYFQRRKTKSIKDLLKASNEDIILDIGCGSGVQLQALDLAAPKLLIGTDLSLNALKYAKNKNIPNCEFVQCDAQQLPFKTQSINKIICAELIEHLPEPILMINEAQRVLKHDGSIVITTPNKISIWGCYEFLWDMFGRGRNYGETHLRFFSVHDLDMYFKSFTTRYATTLFFLSPLVALLNNRTLVQWSKHFDAPFEQTNNGVSIVYYAKK